MDTPIISQIPLDNTAYNEVSYRFYRLKDPRDSSIRYIGQTSRTLEQRLYEHITKGLKRRNGNARLASWVIELVDSGLSPEIEEIIPDRPVYDSLTANIYEAKLIFDSLYRGDKLYNMEAGNFKRTRKRTLF